MIADWIDRAKKWPRLPREIERRQVRAGRAKLCRAAKGVRPNAGPRRLLVDVSVIYRHDARTGIQRVVRALVSQLQAQVPANFVIQPVVATRKQPYRLAAWPPIDGVGLGKPCVAQAGDIFLGLDLSAHIVPPHLGQLSRWKTQGVRFYFMVYDTLPLQHPEWFSAKQVGAFRRWIKAIAILCDGAFCISAIVEQDFRNWLKHRYGMEGNSIRTALVPLGGHIADSLPSTGLSEGFEDTLAQLVSERTVLMVGTLEPRKGHSQVLEAFEHLWQQGHCHNLVFVGRPGWKTEALQQRLCSHPKRGLQLFWFSGASDEALERLYRVCDGVIVASYAEGYGLPLLEALHYGKPVLARDSAIFRQHRSPIISFFEERQADGLAERIHGWLESLPCLDGGDYREQCNLPTWSDAADAVFVELGMKCQTAVEL